MTRRKLVKTTFEIERTNNRLVTYEVRTPRDRRVKLFTEDGEPVTQPVEIPAEAKKFSFAVEPPKKRARNLVVTMAWTAQSGDVYHFSEPVRVPSLRELEESRGRD